MEQISFSSLAERQLASYQNNDMAILRNLHEIDGILTDSILVESFILVVITQGNAQVYVDDKVCELETGDVFVCKPNRILKKSMTSMDCNVFAVFFHLDYVDKIIKELNLGLEFQQILKAYDLIHCNSDELKHIEIYSKLIYDKLNKPDTPNKKKSIDTLFCSMIYELKDVYLRTEEPIATYQLSAAENIMERFFKMLNTPLQPYLNVNGYAEKLNVTPKYFSTICKKYTGKTASQLINEEIIHTAQVRLKDNQYSIQQIAGMLGFANQSHFGVFFHRHTGMSPLQYRTNL